MEILAGRLLAREAKWSVPFFSTEEAIQQAQRLAVSTPGRIVASDTQDNPGVGGDSDTTGMSRALLSCRAQSAAIGLMVDGLVAAAGALRRSRA